MAPRARTRHEPLKTGTTSSRLRSMPLLQVSILALFLAASAAPSPLYPLIGRRLDAGPPLLAAIYGAYPLALLAALLISSRALQQFSGRRGTLEALSLELVGLVTIGLSVDVSMVIIGRAVQGFATGLATTALSSWAIERAGTRAAMWNSLAPLLGMGLGAVGASVALVDVPQPQRTVFFVLAGLVVVSGATVARARPALRSFGDGRDSKPAPETITATSSPGMCRSLRELVPLIVGIWAVVGLYLSLGSELVHDSGDLARALIIPTLMFVAAASLVALRNVTPAKLTTLGAVAILTGSILIARGSATTSAPVIIVAAAVCGLGVGPGFQAALASAVPLGPSYDRQRGILGVYTTSYLATSVPVFVIGFVAAGIGPSAAAEIYAGATALAAAAALVASVRTRRRSAVVAS